MINPERVELRILEFDIHLTFELWHLELRALLKMPFIKFDLADRVELDKISHLK